MKPPHTGTTSRKRVRQSASLIPPTSDSSAPNAPLQLYLRDESRGPIPPEEEDPFLFASFSADAYFQTESGETSFVEDEDDDDDEHHHHNHHSSNWQSPNFVYNSPSRSTTTNSTSNSDSDNNNNMGFLKRRQRTPNKTRATTPTAERPQQQQQQQQQQQSKSKIEGKSEKTVPPESPSGSKATPEKEDKSSNELGWESFDSSLGFPQDTSGFVSDPEEEWPPPYHPYTVNNSKTGGTPVTVASSTVTASTTPSTSIDGSFDAQQHHSSNSTNRKMQVLMPFAPGKRESQQHSSNQSATSSEAQQSTSAASSSDVSHLLTLPQPEDRTERRRLKYEQEFHKPYEAETDAEAVSVNSSADVSHLLILPEPEDRSEQRRLKYEQEKRKTGLYDGELEPEGVRGQQAKVKRGAVTSSPTLPHIRTFSQQKSQSSSSKHVTMQTPDKTILSPARRTRFSERLSSGLLNRTRHQTPPKPILRYSNMQQHYSVPPSDSEKTGSVSTVSDDALREMRPDLLEESHEKVEDESHAPLSPVSPSPVAAAAAAAAAHSIRTGSLSTRGSLTNNWPSPAEHMHVTTHNRKAEGWIDIDEWNRLAMQDVEEGEYDSAITRFTKILNYQKKQYGDLHPAVASAYHNLGTAHAKRASTLPEQSQEYQAVQKAALRSFQAAARTARDSLSPHHPNVAVSLVRIGFLLLQSKQYDNAVITFREALRIRKLAYGPRHSLVANLYNNLGVCQMHQGEFEKGRQALEYALEIQRELLAHCEIPSSTESQGSTSTLATRWTQYLEVADTLFNIGGLCLEWIRKQGNTPRRQHDAEQAFGESFKIRDEILGPDDPLTIQVRDLLDMCLSLPRPRSMSQELANTVSDDDDMEAITPEDVMFSASTPPPAPGKNKACGQNSDFSPPRAASPGKKTSGHSNTPPQFAGRVSRDSSTGKSRLVDDRIPLDQYAIPELADHDLDKAARLPKYKHQRPRPLTPSSVGESRSAPCSSSRSTTPTLTPVYGSETGSRLRGINGLTPMNGRNHYGIAQSIHPDQQESTPTGRSQNPGRQRVSGSGGKKRHDLRPSSSQGSTEMKSPARPRERQKEYMRAVRDVEEDEHRPHRLSSAAMGSHPDSEEQIDTSTPGTKVLVRPHHVPRSPGRGIRLPRHSDSAISPDNERLSPVSTSRYPFDSEENCLIGDSGIDSEYGRVHIPPTWAKAGLVVDEELLDQRQREITVTRPSRAIGPEREPPEKQTENDDDRDSALFYDTGNKERDDIMRRARAFILAYERGLAGENPKPQSDQPSINEEAESDSIGDSVEEALQAEDGLAQLGGDWVSSPKRRRCSAEDMKHDPTTFLPQIHDEACRRLKRDNVAGAVEFFAIISQCQRDRYGSVHEHLASALYNQGIAYLRGQQTQEALECFQEAAEIRKISLGVEHPSVAVSLVKVGIAHLLLHKFEDALLSFREALAVRKHALGALHPSTARIFNNIGCVHVEFDELREARRAFETALDIQRNALIDDPESRGIMLATATTLCNLAYIYRERDLHAKAAVVLKEAADLQETVLGRSHPSVLSTLDCLADSCGTGGQTSDALRYYNMILTRYRAGDAHGSQTVVRAEAVLLYKMSRVHRQRNDRESQLDTLKLALRSVRALSDSAPRREDLERRIVYDMRSCREQIERSKLKWV